MSSPTPPLLTLDEALNITEADLIANRAGRLSDAQRSRLTRAWRRTRWVIIALVVAVGLGATLTLFFGQRSESPILTFIGILLTVINALIVGVGAQSYLRTSRDLRAGSVTAVSGVVSHTIRVSGRVATYVLKLDGQEVIVPRQVFFAVEDGKLYRLYRTPASKSLLAAEPL